MIYNVNDNNDNEEQGEDYYENNNKTDNYQIEDEQNDIWPQRVDIVYAKEIEWILYRTYIYIIFLEYVLCT